MSSINKDTITALIRVFHAASKDGTRYQLNHVKLSTKNGCVLMQATDGYILSELTVVDNDLADLIGGEVFAVAPEAVPLLKLLAKERLAQVFPCGKIDGSLAISFLGSTCTIKTAVSADIKFPDFEQVKPKLTGDEFSIGLNPQFLLNLFKSLSDKERKSEVVTLTFKDHMSAIQVDCDGQYGILMPRETDITKAKENKKNENKNA